MENLIYLDNGATSFPKPEEVYTFMDKFYRQNGVSPGRSGYDLSIETGNIVEDTRKAMTRYFNGTDPRRLIFSLNSTDALNLAISGLLNPGDHVITTTVEHNAVLRPLHHMSLYQDVKVDYIPFDGKGFVDPDDFISGFQSNTRLVVVNHASNVTGAVQPIKEIGKICREKGVTFLVDASQTAGKLPIDIEEMNVDVIAFTGHKSLLGPTGIGGLYVKENLTIKHTRAGGTGVKSAQRHHLEEYPYRLEYGTLNIIGIAGLYAGLNFVLKKGLENIHGHEMDLTCKLKDGLSRIDNVVTYCADDLTNHIGVLSFNIKGFEAVNTGTILDGEYNIACRTGLHCAPMVHEQLGTDKLHGTVRIGFGPFNTMAHVDKAIDAIKEIASIYTK
ncbi:MAG: aminotransferase class V-fold PLP-dependent enzyme [Deltaproteobacteria bacterium]|nr:aminotransferase class V-fold PLP-dependent enzyme [Deltaproteobacteria bacterium]